MQFVEKVLKELPNGRVPGFGDGFPFRLLSDPPKTVLTLFGLKDNDTVFGTIAVPATILMDRLGKSSGYT